MYKPYPHTGYYVYLEATGTVNGSTAVLDSPLIAAVASPQKCAISFGFHMYDVTDTQMGWLQVCAVDANNKEELILQVSGNQGDKWLWQTVFLPATMNKAFMVCSLLMQTVEKVAVSSCVVDPF